MTPNAKAATASSASADLQLPRYWPTWAMMTVFIFIAFECALLAAALKGQWFILLAPAVVCGVKAWDAWKQLKQAAVARD